MYMRIYIYIYICTYITAGLVDCLALLDPVVDGLEGEADERLQVLILAVGPDNCSPCSPTLLLLHPAHCSPCTPLQPLQPLHNLQPLHPAHFSPCSPCSPCTPLQPLHSTAAPALLLSYCSLCTPAHTIALQPTPLRCNEDQRVLFFMSRRALTPSSMAAWEPGP